MTKQDRPITKSFQKKLIALYLKESRVYDSSHIESKRNKLIYQLRSFFKSLSSSASTPAELYEGYSIVLTHLTGDLIQKKEPVDNKLRVLANVMVVVTTLIAEGKTKELDDALRASFTELYETILIN